jgi:hypothetical protein
MCICTFSFVQGCCCCRRLVELHVHILYSRLSWWTDRWGVLSSCTSTAKKAGVRDGVPACLATNALAGPCTPCSPWLPSSWLDDPAMKGNRGHSTRRPIRHRFVLWVWSHKLVFLCRASLAVPASSRMIVRRIACKLVVAERCTYAKQGTHDSFSYTT